jgi:hypothetical protein
MSIQTTPSHSQATPAPSLGNPEQADTQGSPQGLPQEQTEQTKPDPLSPKFAMLAKREKAMRERMRQIEAREQALKSKETEVTSQGSWKDRLKSDFYGTAIEAGLSPDEIATLLLNQPKPEDLKLTEIQREIQALKQQQEQERKQIQDAQAQQYEQAKNQIRKEITLLVDGDESFETIKAMDATEAVLELIEQTYNSDSYVMSVADAAREVEDYLVEQAVSYAKLKKIQSKLAPPAPAEPTLESEKPNPHSQLKPSMQTLSNRNTPSSNAKPLTAKDRRERAIAAFKGQLTS